jgi:hypothetical protein
MGIQKINEDQGSSIFHILQESVKALLELMQLQRLRDFIHTLELRRYLVHAHVAVLDRLMCEVLADINALGTLTSPNHMICPLDARHVVLEHRSVVLLAKLHVSQEGTEVDDLDSHLRYPVILCLRRGERNTLLHLGD